MMIDAIATTRALPWSARQPRRRSRLLAPGTAARTAARHGLRGALQAMCLSAAGGPVELNEPAHVQGSAPVPVQGGAWQVSTGVAPRGTWR